MKQTVMLFALCSSLLLSASPARADGGGADVMRGLFQPTTHNAVVIVLDDSGSMGDAMQGWGRGPQKMEAAKLALKTVLRSVTGDTWVGLLALNAGWQYQLGPLDQSRLNAVIDHIRPDGGTPLARNIKAGADRLLAEREKQFGYGDYRLLVVTDGQETDDNRAIETYPPDVRSRGLKLDVIGVAMAGDHTLAQYAHTYRNAADPGSLERAIREVLAERVDPNDQTGGGDAFEIISGFDPGVAQRALLALGRAGNHPIGEQPPAPQPETTAEGGSGENSSATSSGGGYKPPPSSGCSGCSLADSRKPQAASIELLVLLGFLYLARKRRVITRARSGWR